MSVNTVNAYGRITVTEEAIAEVAGSSALECYGIVDLCAQETVGQYLRFNEETKGIARCARFNKRRQNFYRPVRRYEIRRIDRCRSADS